MVSSELISKLMSRSRSISSKQVGVGDVAFVQIATLTVHRDATPSPESGFIIENRAANHHKQPDRHTSNTHLHTVITDECQS
ncbi:unnamed protein product [Danaus chrysippus]|uniref:(African queen) hypothetical protein n=1 Tax=Danaus chrysippus TaxID=151541 RepID=A0A8J2QI49_9NEOP|nr:unnamed protein product [Danaus chrysippus]